MQRRPWSPAERAADAVVHAVGLTAAAVACVWLLARALPQRGAGEIAALALYGAALMGMLVASAAYNLARPGRRKALLRRIDHAMIFVMIAGTYTPFVAHRLDAAMGMALGATVWTGALLGAAVKLTRPHLLERRSVPLYLLLGWLVVVALDDLAARMSPPALALLLAGGIAYSVGALVHQMERLPFHGAGWHALVLVGAGCHFAAIAAEFG